MTGGGAIVRADCETEMTAMRKPTQSIARRRADEAKQASPRRRPVSIAASDDSEITALKLDPAPLSPEMAAFFRSAEENVGFVPNVLKAFAFDMTKLEAFVAYRNDLMAGHSSLSQLLRQMIASAASAQNRCYYCVTAHGASVRYMSGDPVLGEILVLNYRAARLNKR